MLGNVQITEGHKSVIDFTIWLAKWEKFYKKIFGRKYDFSGIAILQAEDVFAWPVCMAGDISTEDWLSGGKDDPFQVFRLDHHKDALDLSFEEEENERTHHELDDSLDLSFGRDHWTHQYIVRFKANEEADHDLKDISANQIAEMGINAGSLKERLALGRFLYWDRGLILDTVWKTLCAGSRFFGIAPMVPIVNWKRNVGRLSVDMCPSGSSHIFLRARQVVS